MRIALVSDYDECHEAVLRLADFLASRTPTAERNDAALHVIA